MADNEIIKVLERRANFNCEICSCNDENCEGDECEKVISENILDLINRQKAEIERLKDYNENLQTANTALSNEILDIKSEAIREFAERLKAEIKSDLYGDDVMPRGTIDWLVQETTEGENEKI